MEYICNNVYIYICAYIYIYILIYIRPKPESFVGGDGDHIFCPSTVRASSHIEEAIDIMPIIAITVHTRLNQSNCDYERLKKYKLRLLVRLTHNREMGNWEGDIKNSVIHE